MLVDEEAWMSEPRAAARMLPDLRAAREVVPFDPDLSGRWHRHGVPSPLARWNYHPEYEVHLITQGTGWFVVGDCIDMFAAGQLVLVGPNLPHHWISELSPGERLEERDVVFQFHPTWLRSCAALLPECGRLQPLLRQSRRGVQLLGSARRLAAEHLQAIGGTNGPARLGHVFGLLGAMADAPDHERRLLSERRAVEQPGGGPAPEGPERIDLVYAYVLDHLDEPGLTLGEVAAHVGMSPSALSRYFSRLSGRSFSDTVTRMRLARAGKLLRETALPVTAVAAQTGYANLSNFNRRFRAHHGHTPREHRIER